jgi:hypothetical protein
MWANEHVILVATTGGWEYVYRYFIPMTAVAYKSFSGDYTCPTTTVIKVPIDTFSSGTCQAMFSSVNQRWDIQRSGNYNIYFRLSVQSETGNYFQCRFHKNGTFVANTNNGGINPVGDVIFNQDFSLVAGDYLEMYFYSTIGGSKLGGNQADLHFGRITELNP